MMSTQQHTANSQLDQGARAHKSSESCTNSAIDMPSSGRPIRNQNGTHADINNNNNNNNSMNVNTTNSNSTKTSGTGKNRNIIASHYQIAQKIGEGSFGIIFKGYDLLRSNQPIAIKFESRKSEAPQLKDEFRAYKILNNAIKKYYENYERERHRYLSINGIPKVYYFGQEGYYNVLIIQLLGPSLEDLFEWCGRKFSVPTVSRLAIQMIERLQFLHENHMIYRDIKPDNFLIGATTADNTIYMVDYGMVKQYRDPITHVHIPYRERKSLSGTARYMSINTHLGREQSRRDDLESLGNVFVYFLKGQLPWQGLKAPTNKLKYEKIGEKKQRIPISELCSGLPLQVGEYVRQVRNLKFDEDPDYITYINLFKSILDEIENPNYSEGSIQSANSTATAISQLTSNTMKQFPGQFSSNSATIDSAAQELKNLDLEHYEYDWMRLNDGQGWSWNKNKKINLNGYGSGVRHTNTQQTQQLDANHQSHNTHYNDNNNNSKNKRTRSNGQFQKKTAKTRAVSAGGPANERSGLLANGDYANRYTQDGFEDYDTGNNGRNRSVFSWLCCCFI